MQFNNSTIQQFNGFYSKNKLIFWFAPIILVIFFFLRLYNLTLLPVFADEAIYIRWSQVMRAEPTLRFLPLSDGKQPLFMWLTIPFLKIFSDSLVTGRMVSVLSGLGTMVGVFLLTLQLIKQLKVALLAAFLYAVVPFTVFFDRMALVDSLLTCFGVWTLFLGVLLIQYQRLDLAMITGMILGGALLTKSPALFFAILLPATMVLLFSPPRRSAFAHLRGVLRLFGLWLIVYFFAYAVYNILRLGPNFQMIAIRNKDYVLPLAHIFRQPLNPFIPHLKEIWKWFGILLTWPVFLASILGVLRGLREYRKETVLLLGWLLFPLLVQAEYARVFTPRYILFSVPVVLVFASLGIEALIRALKVNTTHCLPAIAYGGIRRWQAGSAVITKRVIILILLVLWALKFDFLLLNQPQKAPLPRRMRSGYLEEWTSGYGIKQVAVWLKKETQKGKILVGTEGYFGTLPDGLQVYLEKVPNITVIGVGYPINEIPEKLENALADNRVFLIVNDSRLNLTEPELQRMKLIAAYSKAVKPDGGQERLLFYEILP